MARARRRPYRRAVREEERREARGVAGGLEQGPLEEARPPLHVLVRRQKVRAGLAEHGERRVLRGGDVARELDVRVRVDVAALLRVDGLADDVVQERAAALGHVQEVHPRRRSQREPDEEAVLHVSGAAARAQRGDVFVAARALLGDVISFSRAIAPWVSQGWLLAVAGLLIIVVWGCSTEFKFDSSAQN